MKTSKQRQPCTRCTTRHTSSGTGLCWHCRPCPTVNLKDGLVHVDGLAPHQIRRCNWRTDSQMR